MSSSLRPTPARRCPSTPASCHLLNTHTHTTHTPSRHPFRGDFSVRPPNTLRNRPRSPPPAVRGRLGRRQGRPFFNGKTRFFSSQSASRRGDPAPACPPQCRTGSTFQETPVENSNAGGSAGRISAGGVRGGGGVHNTAAGLWRPHRRQVSTMATNGTGPALGGQRAEGDWRYK